MNLLGQEFSLRYFASQNHFVRKPALVVLSLRAGAKQSDPQGHSERVNSMSERGNLSRLPRPDIYRGSQRPFRSDYHSRQVGIAMMPIEVTFKTLVLTRYKSLVLLLSFWVQGVAHANMSLDMRELEAGNFATLEKMIEASAKNDNSSELATLLAMREFYKGNLTAAAGYLRSGVPSPESMENNGPSTMEDGRFFKGFWLKNYLDAVLPVYSKMAVTESEHFILRTKEEEKFLADFALEALEKAYQEIGKDLELFPQEKILVEIYSTQEEFSHASTLSKEILDRSGAIGICKFRRLMILSPRQLAFGYRWLDTLAHEYTHYLINLLSGGKCPLWLHEGIAKYLDTRWRLKKPDYLTPGNRTELQRALKEDKLIPFSRMAPSMVYLKDQSEVRLAFSQVSHAIDYALEKEKISLGKFLKHFSTETQEEAFYATMKMSFEQFEKDWRAFLSKEEIKELPGAMADHFRVGVADEVEIFSGTSARGNIRLGDRLRQRGQLQAALIQYERALKQEPANPVALTKSARTLLALGQKKEAIQQLEKCIEQNPNYATAYLLLSEKKLENGEGEQAKVLALEANAINPFNPQVHLLLSQSYELLGAAASAQKSKKIHLHLLSQL